MKDLASLVTTSEVRPIGLMRGQEPLDDSAPSVTEHETEIMQPMFVAREVPGPVIALTPHAGVDKVLSAETSPKIPVLKQAALTPGGTELAWSLIGSMLAIAAMMGALIWLGRRRARSSFERKFKDYREKAVSMMDRLDALKLRLQNLAADDPDFTEPITGATLELYQEAQEKLRALWDRWLEVMDVADKARTKGDLGAKDVAKADALISEDKVFEDVERDAEACATLLDRLNLAHEQAREAATTLISKRKEAVDHVNALGSLSLSLAPYQPELERIEAEGRKAETILTPDPIGSQTVLAAAIQAVSTLNQRAADVASRFADARNVQKTLDDLRSEIADHRRQGLRLTEQGGDPDAPTALAEQALSRLQSALETGDPELATVELTAAQSSVNQARDILKSVIQAKASLERGVPDARRETRRLAEARTQYSAFERELNRDFAPASWREVAGHMAQAQALLETFDRKADEIDEAGSSTSQQYLLAARLLGRLNLEQRTVFQLMNAVGERLTALKGVRAEAERLTGDLAQTEQDVRRFFQQYDHVVGPQARASLKAAEAARADAARRTSPTQPDWPEMHKALQLAREEYGIARSQAQSDLDVYQLLTNEYDQARLHATRVESYLAGRSEDRPAANQRFRHAEEVLNRIGQDSTRVGNEWPRLLDQVRNARRDLEQAERLAQKDVHLARQAETGITEAAQMIRQGRVYLSMGVSVDVAPAEALISQAQSHYWAQRYEEAIRAAAEAVERVQAAHQTAVQQSYIRRMHSDAQQRRQLSASKDFGTSAASEISRATFGGTGATSMSTGSADVQKTDAARES